MNRLYITFKAFDITDLPKFARFLFFFCCAVVMISDFFSICKFKPLGMKQCQNFDDIGMQI